MFGNSPPVRLTSRSDPREPAEGASQAVSVQPRFDFDLTDRLDLGTELILRRSNDPLSDQTYSVDEEIRPLVRYAASFDVTSRRSPMAPRAASIWSSREWWFTSRTRSTCGRCHPRRRASSALPTS